MSRFAIALLALLFAGCASVGSREIVTLPAFFVCGRDVYWFEHPPVKTVKVPRFSAPKNLLYSLPPDYVYEARLKLWEGTVLLELHVTPEGIVDHVKIVEHSRYPVLDESAKIGFRRWRFTRGTADRVRIPVTFSLHCAE
jgi:TonB family protein